MNIGESMLEIRDMGKDHELNIHEYCTKVGLRTIKLHKFNFPEQDRAEWLEKIKTMTRKDFVESFSDRYEVSHTTARKKYREFTHGI